jgi:hypothetical protein
MSVEEIQNRLDKLAGKEKAQVMQRFFKTGPGEYGKGDVFLGIKVPELRTLAKEYQGITLKESKQLLKSPIHEQRLLALLIFIRSFSKGDEGTKRNS